MIKIKKQDSPLWITRPPRGEHCESLTLIEFSTETTTGFTTSHTSLSLFTLLSGAGVTPSDDSTTDSLLGVAVGISSECERSRGVRPTHVSDWFPHNTSPNTWEFSATEVSVAFTVLTTLETYIWPTNALQL